MYTSQITQLLNFRISELFIVPSLYKDQQGYKSLSLPNDDGSHSNLNYYHLGFGCFAYMPMEGSELGMVEAKAAREVSERARFQGKSLQTVVRRCQRIDVNDKRRYG